MSLFYVEHNVHMGQSFELGGDNARHLLMSRRVRVGETLKIQAPMERYECVVRDITKTKLTLEPVRQLALPPEPVRSVVVAQSYIAEQALDLVLQKGTELGCDAFLIFPSVNSPHMPKDSEKKLARWKKIAYEAAKQSERVVPPEVFWVESLSEVLRLSKDSQVVVLAQGADRDYESLTDLRTILLTGPEGGFTQDELRDIEESGAAPLGVGPYVLRAETASIAGVALLVTT